MAKNLFWDLKLVVVLISEKVKKEQNISIFVFQLVWTYIQNLMAKMLRTLIGWRITNIHIIWVSTTPEVGILIKHYGREGILKSMALFMYKL